jgi:hypothetical protein
MKIQQILNAKTNADTHTNKDRQTGTQAHTRTHANKPTQKHTHGHAHARTPKPRNPACIQGMTNLTCHSWNPGLKLMRGHFLLSRKDQA